MSDQTCSGLNATVADLKKRLGVHSADILAVEVKGEVVELDDSAKVVTYPRPGASG